MDPDTVIIEPVLTEKTNSMRESEVKSYVFKVHQQANKYQIMKAVYSLFSVRPQTCRIINVKPKPRSSRTKSGNRVGFTSTWKKAIVTLPKGERIDVFEGS